MDAEIPVHPKVLVDEKIWYIAELYKKIWAVLSIHPLKFKLGREEVGPLGELEPPTIFIIYNFLSSFYLKKELWTNHILHGIHDVQPTILINFL